ncbi:GNAT family N-acetyltransferase [Amycolatopsis sp. cmx-8-4]|uniref:GNAT family N-acetyltransferase n=1 Tax=Amycolatopsis sp. cmx-8-4 TaxID=2790947 RepID=UPI00397A8538
MEPELGAGREPVHRVTADDRRVVPLWEGLRAEYRQRYGPAADRELARFPAADFAPPDGGFVVLTLDGETIAGGGFRRYDEHTAEFKRLWTAPAHRRGGLARRTLAVLDEVAAEAGYRRVYFVTGPHQPEAVRLYLTAGYRRLPDDPALTEGEPALRFEKFL